ncbi:hypothetical protein BDF20DRAFT_883234 [Mycotypha africana]|uniref:uncharacterized protein n=1 Tax=Mycotypha africana TaxID=64632 RepID=UPI0023017416|nr:uncharacterized protein BDF20DRAFT_883234 [Mycotypha africana]KAI8973605.1 hypothetical protein BDF20DRAFT_883234 [Mycotypha africana]
MGKRERWESSLSAPCFFFFAFYPLLIMANKLSPAGKRLATIIVSAPFVVATSWILYKRLVLGEEPRKADGRAVRPLGVRELQERENNNKI